MSQNTPVELLQIEQPGPLRHRCRHCKISRSTLAKCAGCSIVRYCSRDHQVADWIEHKSYCERIKTARTKLSEEDAVVQAGPSHLVITAHGPHSGVNQVRFLATTREYQQARLHLADSVRTVGTLDGILEALRHFLEMVWQWPIEHAYVRGVIPTLLLQLDEDQGAYDLVKFWSKASTEEDDDLADTSSSRSRIANSDVFEDVTHLEEENCDINYLCAILLLKIKLLMDMRNIRIVRKLVPLKLSAEIVAKIELAVIRSPLSVQSLRLTGDDFYQQEMRLNEHVLQLGCRIHKANVHFWKSVLDPRQSLVDQPRTPTPGSLPQASFMIQYNYSAWYQTEGVIQAMECALAMNKDKDDMVAMWSNLKAALEI